MHGSGSGLYLLSSCFRLTKVLPELWKWGKIHLAATCNINSCTLYPKLYLNMWCREIGSCRSGAGLLFPSCREKWAFGFVYVLLFNTNLRVFSKWNVVLRASEVWQLSIQRQMAEQRCSSQQMSGCYRKQQYEREEMMRSADGSQIIVRDHLQLMTKSGADLGIHGN